MSEKLKSLLQQLLQSPRHFPVEAALGVAFFIIAVVDTETSAWNKVTSRMESAVNVDILKLFIPLVVLSFWLQRVNRKAYFASFFLFLPLMALNLQLYPFTYGFVFTYVVAAILLVVGNRRMDNRPFAAHTLHVVTQIFFGLLITGILNTAVVVIFESFFYIFGITELGHFYDYITKFIWFVLAPQVCCTLVRQNEYETNEPAKVLRLILNFILSPAVIIYTVILYSYFVKIVFEWDLPKGGVAWIVMGFITVALIGRMAQSILSQRYYDWYYRYFTLIAIPPLIMYWIGSIYRISLYSFTESRFYLLLAGGLMTLFVLMQWKERTRRYQLMALIFGATIVLFTYIPGISAKSIGLHCQEQRLTRLISELELTDTKTGKLKDSIDIKRIMQDSLLCKKYQDVSDVISYVRDEIGEDKFKKQYGEWTHSKYYFERDMVIPDDDTCIKRQKPADVGEYRMVLPSDKYELLYNGDTVTVKFSDDKTVLSYPINAMVSKDTTFLHHPEQLLTYHNDSILLVLETIYIDSSSVTNVNQFRYYLFKKPAKGE